MGRSVAVPPTHTAWHRARPAAAQPLARCREWPALASCRPWVLLHHLLGNLHIHDARAAGEEEPPPGRFLSLLVEAFGGSAGDAAEGPAVVSGDASVLKRAFANLEALHAHIASLTPGVAFSLRAGVPPPPLARTG